MWNNSWKHIIGTAVIVMILSFLIFDNPLFDFILGLFAIAILGGAILGFVFEMIQKIWKLGKVSKQDFWATILGGFVGWLICVVIRVVIEL